MPTDNRAYRVTVRISPQWSCIWLTPSKPSILSKNIIQTNF